MYSPRIGQWLSEDPIEFESLDDNLKRYVNNSPINMTDPTGNIPYQNADLYGGGPTTTPQAGATRIRPHAVRRPSRRPVPGRELPPPSPEDTGDYLASAPRMFGE